MTRKQALLKALECLNDEAARKKIIEVIDELPFTRWSESTIFDTVDQFVLENGKISTAKEFDKRGMPPHPVIQLRFGLTVREFLDKYYPVQKQCDSKIYCTKTKEEWLAVFIQNYNTVQPTGANQYNELREKGTPTWGTYARLLGLSKWNELLKIAQVERCEKAEVALVKEETVFTIVSHDDLVMPGKRSV